MPERVPVFLAFVAVFGGLILIGVSAWSGQWAGETAGVLIMAGGVRYLWRHSKFYNQE
jgi:hypothetical protein